MTTPPTTPWTTADILAATNGALVCGDPRQGFDGISIDSRRIIPGQLFVAIVGQKHDGHRFIEEALRCGVQGVVVGSAAVRTLPWHRWRQKGIVVAAVDDTARALGDLAAFHRRRHGVPVVAITGSNGKTSTKDMTAAVLGRRPPILATMGNLNNEIGVPLTLLRLAGHERWAVIELGMNHAGEIARLTDICAPRVGIITNIGPAHLEALRSVEGVRDAKGELLGRLPSGATAILNADDAWSMQLARQTARPVVRFGRSPEVQIGARDVTLRNLTIRFTLTTPQGDIPIRLPTPGAFMVSNALAAAAVGDLAGMSLEEIKAGLEDFRPASGRLTIFQTARGVNVIDDSYNANPASMQAAIGTLAALSAGGRAIWVAGEMRELGPQAAAMHRDVGELAARSGIAKIYATGPHAREIARGARSAGMHDGDIVTGSRQEIADGLSGRTRPGDWILIKGSRAAGMEVIADALRNGEDPPQGTEK